MIRVIEKKYECILFLEFLEIHKEERIRKKTFLLTKQLNNKLNESMIKEVQYKPSYRLQILA
jgi:hypothetical protein